MSIAIFRYTKNGVPYGKYFVTSKYNIGPYVLTYEEQSFHFLFFAKMYVKSIVKKSLITYGKKEYSL